MKKIEKTNVMRLLDQKEIPYQSYHYEAKEAVSAVEAARLLDKDEDMVYKTLVTQAASKEHYVFVIPGKEELDLKKAAKAVNEKSIAMVKSKDLLNLTGYVHGGCSPIGMKKFFVTTIDETAILQDTIIFSAGKIGYQVEMTLDDLAKIIDFQLVDVIVEKGNV